MAKKSIGYDPKFTGVTLKMPKVPATKCAPLKKGTGKEIKYIHYSSFLHKDRQLPLLCASNIRGEGYAAPDREGPDPWEDSEQVLAEYQLNNSFYGNDENTFDRGHIVRRVDTIWADEEEDEDFVLQAELDTFKWSNCTPQHKKLNQQGGVWFELEQHVMENGVKNKIADISVFAGPVLSKDDKYMQVKKGKLKGEYIQIPTEYWKVIVWKKSNGKLYAVGFIMSQWEFIKHKVKDLPAVVAAVKKPVKDDYFENLKFKDHHTYQVKIDVIEKKTGISFNWTNVSFPYKAAKAKIVKAQPLKKKIMFASYYNKLKEAEKKKGAKPAQATIRTAVQKEAPLSQAKIKTAVSKGFRASIKEYKLINITL